MASVAVGIDLGTTNSVVAVSQGGKPRVLALPDGSSLIPSVVSFHPSGQTIVGATARARRAADPTNTVFSVKRLLGRPFNSEEVRRASVRFAFELREGPDAAILVRTRAGDLSLPEISALVLREIRRVAELALGDTVERAIVTVPANFNELQRTATKVAGRIADLDVIRILNEPTAASLAYGYGRGTRERIAVYDFGGGTFDVTLLELSGNVFEVLATAGDTFLGGDDIDLLITENLADGLMRSMNINARDDRRAFEMLRAAAEQAKIDLSTGDVAAIRIPEIGYSLGGGALEFRTRISRPELERLAAPLVARTFEVCNEALKLAGLRPQDFQSVILVGGSTRMPAVQTRVAAFFGRDPLMTLPPESVVGLGAAVLAEALSGGRRLRTGPVAPAAPRPGGAATTPSVARAPAAVPEAPGESTATPPRRGHTLDIEIGAVPTAGASAATAGTATPAARKGTTLQMDGGAARASSPDGSPLGPPIASRLRGNTNPGMAPVLPPPRPGDMSWEPAATPRGARSPIDELDEPDARSPLPGTPGSVTTSLNESEFGGDAPVTRVYPPGYVPPSQRPAPVSSPLEAKRGPAGSRTALGGSAPEPGALPPPPAPPRAPARAPASSVSDDDLDGQPTDFFSAATMGQPARGLPPVVPGASLPLPPARPPAESAMRSPPDGAIRATSPVAPSPAPMPPPVPVPVPASRHVGNTTAKLMAAVPPPALIAESPAAFAATMIVPAAPLLPPPTTAAPAAMSPALMQTVLAAPPAALPPRAPPAPAPVPATAPMPAYVAKSAPITDSFLGFAPGPPPGTAPSIGALVPTGAASVMGINSGLFQPPAPSNPPSAQAQQLAPPLLLDVTPHSLGLETLGGLCEVIIPRNATIPVEQTREFATAYDGQDVVRIRIAQGESRRFTENHALGELELSNITAAPRGEVKVAVTFELDADGTIQVRAREVATGRQTATRVALLTMPSAAEMAGMAQRQRG